jgi:hypothetical protein
MSYHWQKLYSAIESLIGNGPLQERLCYAEQALLMLRRPPLEFPAQLKEEFESVWQELEKFPTVESEGSNRVTKSAMSSQEAEKISNRLFGLFCEVAKQDAIDDFKRHHNEVMLLLSVRAG